MKIDPTDGKAMQALYDSLPEGWAVGPTHCPIGIDSAPMLCSAGYCLACQWLRAHWDEKPDIRLVAPTRT